MKTTNPAVNPTTPKAAFRGFGAAGVAGVALAFGVFSPPAQATSSYDPVTGIISIAGTGENQATGGADANYSITAMPNGLAATLYIPTSTQSVFYPGSNTTNTAVNNNSGGTNRWVSYSLSSTSLTYSDIYPSEPPLPASDPPGTLPTQCGATLSFSNACNYSYVVSTSFTVTKSGYYDFNYAGTADNRSAIYLGGTVSGSGTTTPGITGGTLLSPLDSGSGPAIYKTGTTSNILLTAGTYQLNYVITDFFNPGNLLQSTYGSTGLFINNTFFKYTSAVPGPLPILGAGAFFAHSRRLRRRIKNKKVEATA